MKQGFQLASQETLVERAYLVGVSLPDSPLATEKEHLEELQQLVTTAGAIVVGRSIQGRTRIDGATFIGPGKAREIKSECKELNANLVVFDHDLSPAQARNLEKILDINVIDRTELILDIFARHARSQQARIQVELAQLIYSLPRLRKLWDHLSRQQGGVGTRGPGETQLEVDRRRVRERISRLKKQLKTFDKQKDVLRKSRNGHSTVALVGYTNTGKSTLMNALTGADTLAENQLFATLDTLTRRFDTSDNTSVLLVDTVGFIRKLPHHLVESFKATLGDIGHADLCLHIIDVSHHAYTEQMAVTDSTLKTINGSADHVLHVFNKIDAVDRDTIEGLKLRHPEAVFISAARQDGLDELTKRIDQTLFGKDLTVEVMIRTEDGKSIAAVKRLVGQSSSAVKNGFCVITGVIRTACATELENIDGASVRYLL